jgi:hypothetical protein
MSSQFDLNDLPLPQVHALIHHLQSKDEAKFEMVQSLLSRFAAGLEGAPEIFRAPIDALLKEFTGVLNEIERASRARIDEIAAGFGGAPKTLN